MGAVVEFSHVSKDFWTRRGGASQLKHHLIKPFNKKSFIAVEEHKTVLKDVSFKIQAGDFIGIMGRNGVGKSTLLKILAGIYTPNEGKIFIHGSIAPVLELGAGFAEELTGYENIFLNASILGYGKRQVKRAIDEIIDFSELEEQINDPVRNYSSGMLVRLAFSIACHLQAQILLFDEILAVGDLGFQKKCIRKISELNRSNHSIVLVTHNPDQVSQFCNRCLVLDHGTLIFDGDAKSGAHTYKGLFG